jgi:hypothetical protein
MVGLLIGETGFCRRYQEQIGVELDADADALKVDASDGRSSMLGNKARC